MALIGDQPIKRTAFWPPRDREENLIPHKLETISFLKAVPHVLTFFDKMVPAEFWNEELEPATGKPQIIIACPCGEEPVLHFAIRTFSIEECACGRFFLHDGSNVRCGRDEEADVVD